MDVSHGNRGVYLRSTLSNSLLQKVLTMVPLTATRPMTNFLSNLYDDLEGSITHLNIIKRKSYLGDNVTDFCALVLVYAENIERSGAFYLEHLGYIAHIFIDTSVSRFHIWVIQKYKEVTGLLRIFMCMTWMSYNLSSS